MVFHVSYSQSNDSVYNYIQQVKMLQSQVTIDNSKMTVIDQ